MSGTEAGLPLVIPAEYMQVKESDEESQEESSMTPSDTELEMKQEEGQTKRIFEQGDGSNTTYLFDDQVSRILTIITAATSEIQAQVKKHAT